MQMQYFLFQKYLPQTTILSKGFVAGNVEMHHLWKLISDKHKETTVASKQILVTSEHKTIVARNIY
jgi:hypothetical protein